MRRVVIWAPGEDTRRSAGIHALYELSAELRRRDMDAVTVAPGQVPAHELECSTCRGSIRTAIHVLPEGAAPLNMDLEVRWLLGKHRPFRAPLEVTWHRELFPDAEELRVSLLEEWLFRPGDGPRSGSLVYFGKAPAVPVEGPNLTVITRFSPHTRGELAELLRSSEVLYTFDNFTHLVLEAAVCGCPVLVMDPAGAPASLWDTPGVFGDSFGLEAAREAVTTAPEWYERVRARNAASIDRFAERLRAL